ncbi:hypothetical protein ACFOWM_03595 [Ferruginibacter yonginensis]|uniref:Uncharacterized protein n=1 Tax=Ferruginibacter yonginensis TaxID=1310416 RepID=A0ABV8QQ61_9BACT
MLQLFVCGHKILEWDIFFPSFPGRSFEQRCDAKHEFLKLKMQQMKEAKYNVIAKYDDYEFVLMASSKVNEIIKEKLLK